MLVLQRKESYPGQLGPEVLAIVDEVTLDDNGSWWTDEIQRHKASVGDEADAWAVIEAVIPTKALMDALYPPRPTLQLTVTPVEDPT